MSQYAQLGRILALASVVLASAACSDKPNPDASAVVVQPEPAFKVAGGTIPQSATLPTTPTKMFLERSAIGGLYLVQINQAALARSTSEAVKSFAQEVLDESATLAAEMEPVSTSAGILLPTALDEPHMSKLSQLTDANLDFDATYKTQLLEELNADLQQSTSYADTGDNDALKAFAKKRAGVMQRFVDTLNSLETPT